MKNHKIFKSLILLALCTTIVPVVHANEHVFSLPMFNVYGDRYKIRSRLANKIPTAEKYTPATVNTVDEEELEKKNARTIQDALSDETGLIGNYRGDIPFQNYAKIRGIELDSSDLLVDGMRAFSTQMQIFTPEIFGMEKVEVLRGPNSTFQGSGSGGGVINMQLKSPKHKDYATGEIRIGTKNEKTITFDINRTNKNNESAMRFVGLLSKKDLFFDQSSNTRIYFAPSFEKQTEKDRFTIKPFYQYDYVDGSKDQPQIKLKGNPKDFTDPDTGVDLTINKGHPLYGLIPDRKFIGVKGWDKYYLKQWGINTEWEHKFEENISFVQSLSARKTTVLSQQTRGWPNEDFSRVMRDGVAFKLEGNSFAADQYFKFHKDTSKASRDTILGVTYNYEHTYQSDLQCYRFNYLPFDKLPDYMSGKEKWTETWNPWEDQDFDVKEVWGREYGIYASHTEHVGKWHLSGGIRRGLFKQHNGDESLPLQDIKLYATTGQIGAVYEWTDEWLPYIHWDHGFRPNYIWDKEHNAIPPTTSTEWEGGVRYESRDGKTKGSISTFNLKQHNVPSLVLAPSVEDSYAEPIGKVCSKGIDFKYEKQINPTWNISASYSFLIAKILEDQNPENIGKSMAESPKHMLTIQTEKILSENEKGKWIVNAGVRYRGSSSDQSNKVILGGATVYDLGLTYERKNDKFSLQVKNLFDKKYFVSLYQDWAKIFKDKTPGEHKPGNIPDEGHMSKEYEDPYPNIGFLGDERTVMFTYSYTW